MYRYSKRLSVSLEQSAFAQLLQEKAKAGIPLLDLTSSNPTSCFTDYPHVSIQAAFSHIQDFHYNPDPFGTFEARSHIAQYYADRGIAVSEAQILLTASTSEAYSLLFKLLCDPGDEILIPTPSYPLFDYLATLECVNVVTYHLRYDGTWYLDLVDLEQKISPRTRAIVIVNPNNPTGSYLTTAERDRLVEIALKHRLPLICDEVFIDYGIRARSAVAKTLIGTDAVLSFSLNGLSKAAGMPQLKLAWIVMNGPLSELRLARERLEMISDTYLSVATPVQKAVGLLLQAGSKFQQQIQARLSENLSLIDHIFQGRSAHRLQLDGGWSAILQLPQIRTEEEWITGLVNARQVLVQPGYYFDMPMQPCLVISLLTESGELGEGLKRLQSYLHQCS